MSRAGAVKGRLPVARCDRPLAPPESARRPRRTSRCNPSRPIITLRTRPTQRIRASSPTRLHRSLGWCVVGIDPEDEKLVTLARSARARTGAAEGAAVRDERGRTYAAVTVALPSLELAAWQAPPAAEVASGAQQLEAAAVVSEAQSLDPASAAVAADLGVSGPLLA